MLVSELVEKYLLLGNNPEMDAEEGHYDTDTEWAMDKAKSLMEAYGSSNNVKISNIKVEKDRVSFTVASDIKTYQHSPDGTEPEPVIKPIGTEFVADSDHSIVVANGGIHFFNTLGDAYQFFHNYVD
jgi:hypothetical protein